MGWYLIFGGVMPLGGTARMLHVSRLPWPRSAAFRFLHGQEPTRRQIVAFAVSDSIAALLLIAIGVGWLVLS